MKIKDKLNMNTEQLTENGPITIVVFGDSITHGAFGPGEIDYEAVYWNILKKRLNEVRNYVPIKMDLFMEKSVKLAKEMGISVCDCYSVWKELNKTTDTTMLLENRINHPTREMHKMFANKLFSLLIDEKSVFNNNSDTMWNREKERACNGTERY